MTFKILENRIADPKDHHKYQENTNWLLGLWDTCECGHNRGGSLPGDVHVAITLPAGLI